MPEFRVLGLTNFYPPDARGGYGEICADVMEGLAARGHEVTMLVARGEIENGTTRDVEVRRELAYVLAPWRRPLAALKAAAHDQEIVRRAIEEGFDAAIAWHMRGLMKTSLRLLHDAGMPVIYMLHDRWVLYERAGPWLAPWPLLDRYGFARLREVLGSRHARRLELRAPPIEREGIVCFASEWLRKEYARLGWRPENARILPSGVRLEDFATACARPPRQPARRLLYAGRVHPTKGLEVAVRALAKAQPESTLTVAGLDDDPRYLARVYDLASELGVADRITWCGSISRASIIELLASNDVLVYPSLTPEAGFLGLLEGLAAERLVVTSALGAPLEQLVHEQNSLFFNAGDADDLARQLRRLDEEPELGPRLLLGARATAGALSLDSVLDQTESLLEESSGTVT
jgi:glycosyltransferase involved in cell wall biosynthesis